MNLAFFCVVSAKSIFYDIRLYTKLRVINLEDLNIIMSGQEIVFNPKETHASDRR
jgi:cytochrome b subunit of formate dehydrogenase